MAPHLVVSVAAPLSPRYRGCADIQQIAQRRVEAAASESQHCAARIFVECAPVTVQYELSGRAAAEQRVLELRPDALFRSFLFA